MNGSEVIYTSFVFFSKENTSKSKYLIIIHIIFIKQDIFVLGYIFVQTGEIKYYEIEIL